ncbi:ABC transporter permease [Gracilibacillus alcaliphilus]|uniref:ABC transporter permease n=1 Tax=Gracilibacillus alcaliphilus TaxID=1401441 RepID=UPI00195E29D1|nr:ABC transporter permease [Gracilibacillus alcaliphilus]MBM7675306.1 ABC-2 type transport system permease protein [Gracilibacillus alcaliphilus]
MMNYIKSEHYRLLRKPSLYVTSGICLLFQVMAALLLYFFNQFETDFPYATSRFLYSNVVSSGTLLVIIAMLFNLMLTGKDMSLIKQAISFGISRTTIFWTKFMLTLSYFLLLCIASLFLIIGLGENLLSQEENSIANFLIALSNMIPLVFAGFSIIHMMRMLKVATMYIIIFLLVLFTYSGELFWMIFRSINGLNELYKYGPDILLRNNLNHFMDQAAYVDYRCWITGIVLAFIALLIGTRKFTKQNID